jgi:hypothetical protein
MDILALRLLVRENEVNELLPTLIPTEAAVQNLRVRLTPEGLVVQGEYPTFMVKMAFETLWQLSVAAGVVHARLASVKVAGLPATLLRGVLLKVLRDVTAQHAGLRVDGETLCIDVSQALKARKIPANLQVTSLHCGAGEALIEAGLPNSIAPAAIGPPARVDT